MAEYRRPCFEVVPGTPRRRAAPQYPYSRAMLRAYDAFHLFPMDCGGFFFTQQHLGGADTKRYLDALRSGRLLGPWKRRPGGSNGAGNIDWLARYDDSKPKGYQHQTVEQHVWLNRLYFLLPIAQEFLRTGNRRWAQRWFEYFRGWSDSFPPPEEGAPEPGPGRAYVLRDMQVAWRLAVMIHSVAMLGGRRGALAPEQWAVIYRAIGAHARRVCAETKKQIPKRRQDPCPYNHFLHKGAILVYAGVLYPELEGAAEWVRIGRRAVYEYSRRHIYPDGGSVEACPGYSHFIARLCLDTHALLAANGRPGVPGLRGHVLRQYSFLARTASPDGRSLQWGDSYSLDVRRDLEIAGRLLPLGKPDRKGSVCFPASQVAVLRSRHTAVYLDAMRGGKWHIHRGKPHIQVYHRGRPVLIDSGCVNYDKESEREGWLKTRSAHNAVVVEPVEKDEWPGDKTLYKLVGCSPGPQGGTVKVRCTYGGRVKYSWLRTVRLEGDRIEVIDAVRGAQPVRCVSHLHLAACRVQRRGGGFAARGPEWRLTGSCAGASGRALRPSLERHLAIDDANRRFMAPDVTFRQRGRAVTFRTLLQLESGAAKRGKT